MALYPNTVDTKGKYRFCAIFKSLIAFLISYLHELRISQLWKSQSPNKNLD
jgi:hypothetical protein